VLAVGGYGRRQLFPYSDVDLLLLFESEKLAVDSKDAIAAFLRHLWDSDLRVSHSVRTPAECTEVHDRNIELNISLLDQRYLTGDRALYAGVAEKLPRFIQGNRGPLVRNLAQLARARHAKYAGTFYHLEPNVKETPGGLRDHQLVCWLDQLHGGRDSPPPEMEAAFRFLGRLRCYLHYQSGRDNNALSFDARTHRGAMAEWRCAQWMREYYRHARSFTAPPYARWMRARPVQLAVRAVPRLALASGERRLHGASGAHPLPRSATPGGGAGTGAEPVRIRGAPRHTSFRGGEQQIESRIASLRAHFAEPRPLWPSLNTILALPYAPLAVRRCTKPACWPPFFRRWSGSNAW